MPKPVMLWFDCVSTHHHRELRPRCAELFTIACSSRPEQATQDIERLQPKVLCFDFDYPDRAGLRALQVTKREHMSLPVLMLTVEHSEALAVWAFRARVWNYLVKPIPEREFEENLRVLAQIARAKQRQTGAVARPEPGIPHEVPSRLPDDPHLSLLPAISYIERHFNQRLSASEVAKLCGMSRFGFSRLFRSTFGVTFQDFLLRYRIAESCRLLRRPAASVTDVSYAVGFNDPSYFARIFKRYTGTLPSEYAGSQTRAASLRLHPALAVAGAEALTRPDDDGDASTDDAPDKVMVAHARR
jgi:AraC-like DNA-binding protein